MMFRFAARPATLRWTTTSRLASASRPRCRRGSSGWCPPNHHCHYSTSSARWASTLVLSEPLAGTSTAVPAATCAAVTAAQQLKTDAVDLLVVGPTAPTRVPVGVGKVWHATTTATHPTAESVALAVQQVAATEANTEYSHVVGTSTKFGSTVVPRAAALLQTSPITDIVEIVEPLVFIRPMYAGNALAKVQASAKQQQQQQHVLSIRPTSFEKAELQDVAAETVTTTSVEDFAGSEFVGEHVSSGGDRPDLGSASVVVSGGRGMGSGEQFAILEQLVDALGGGAVGASRAAVDAGMVPNDWQVGQVRALLIHCGSC